MDSNCDEQWRAMVYNHELSMITKSATMGVYGQLRTPYRMSRSSADPRSTPKRPITLMLERCASAVRPSLGWHTEMRTLYACANNSFGLVDILRSDQ
jgi:hypothetical protein